MALPLAPREILEKLVSFPTVSQDSNRDLVDWIAEYLLGLGVVPQQVLSPDGKKAHLFAQVGPDVTGGVALSGHTDVVPVEGQRWRSDPWVLTERDGRLYGRGACDMKGFNALALAAVPMARAAPLRRPLQLAFSYDEEVGCHAVCSLIDEMAVLYPRAGAVIVGEPTMMQVVTGHKGGTGYEVRVQGVEVHSSMLHKGVSAIMEAARLISWANLRNAEGAAAVPGALAAPFDPPWTTVHVGTIRGGTAGNITAGECRFTIEFRVVPGESVHDWEAAFEARAAEVEADMQAVHPEARVMLEKYYALPPLRPEKSGCAEALARQLTGDNGSHVVSYGTEAGQFQKRGFSTVICGPGSIAQAHQADEFITIAQLDAGQHFMQRLIAHLSE